VTAQNSLVRFARPSDCEQLARLRHALWPEGSVEEHARELENILRGKVPGTMPLVEIVYEASHGALLGFIEVGVRSHADECDPAQPVGYVEGWYVADACRRQGIGAVLLRAAEDWSRRQGCKEIASDALIENELSQRAHEALGFQVVGRNVLYRKKL
jgi:aminoglycoside 6'-N-acetyltransferase I